MLNLIYATLLKIFRLRMKSRLILFAEVFSTTSALFVFYLIDKFQQGLVGDRLKDALSGMNTTYFGYVALGLAVAELSNSCVGGVLGQFQEDKRHGTLEMHLASGVSIRRWSAAAGVANFFRALFQFALIFVVAVGVLGLRLPTFKPEVALLVLVVALLPFWALSLISLCSVLLLRRGYVFGFLISTAFELFSGVYVPVKVLPDWVQPFAEVLPITPALRALQAVFYQNAGFADVQGDLARVALLGMIYVPAAWILLGYTDLQARRKGFYVLD